MNFSKIVSLNVINISCPGIDYERFVYWDGLYLLENDIINEARIIENDKSKTL